MVDDVSLGENTLIVLCVKGLSSQCTVLFWFVFCFCFLLLFLCNRGEARYAYCGDPEQGDGGLLPYLLPHSGKVLTSFTLS